MRNCEYKMPRMHNLCYCESPTVPHGRMFWSAILVLTLTTAAVRANSTATVLPVPSEKLVCSFLKQPLCRMAGYNQTAFPNQRQHETQEEATGEMVDFSKLWTEGSSCSNAIVYFLCSYILLPRECGYESCDDNACTAPTETQ